MRVDVAKYIFLGTASQKDLFFKEFQKAGLVQFLGSKVSFIDLLSTDFQEVIQAIKILNEYEVDQTPQVQITDPLEFSRIVISEKLTLTDKKQQLKTAKEQLQLISPFGSIPLQEILSLQERIPLRFRLFVAPRKKNALSLSPHLILINEDDKKQYFLSLTKEEVSISSIEEVSLAEDTVMAAKEVSRLKNEIQLLEEQLHSKASLISSLKSSLVNDLNVAKYQKASTTAIMPLEDRLFAVYGWVPESKIEHIESLSTSLNMYCAKLVPHDDEVPPTYLENSPMGELGEDLVDIYDTPAHTDTDPSSWVLFFFALFFAMIISDGGYGLIFLLSALLMKRKSKTASPGYKRFTKLFTILGAFCIAWGLLTGTFFSIALLPSHPLKTHSLVSFLVRKQAAYRIEHKDEAYESWVAHHNNTPPADLEQFLIDPSSPGMQCNYELFADGILMELALLVGTIHIMLSIIRYLHRNIGNAGWLIATVGGYMYVPHYLHANSVIYYLFHLNPEVGASVGLQLVGFGVLFSVFVSIIKNGITGIFELMTGIQVFADILSYLRIYALGLSGAIFAGMINSMSDKFPFIIATILILLAHGMNIVLSVVGGVIHGLRLNFLEWYHYSFEGGGKKFSPLTLETYK